MRTVLMAMLAAGLCVSVQAGKPGGGGGGGCTTSPPVNFTVVDYNPGIASDGGGQYVSGVSGVIGRLNCNGDSAELSGARHTFLNLGTPLDGKSPSWSGSPGPISFFNIPFGNCFNNGAPNCPSFLTYLKVVMLSPASGFFNMENSTGAVGGLQAPSGGMNSPCMTAQVQVTHYDAGTYPGTPAAAIPVPSAPAASSNTGAPETWYVAPVASLSSCGSEPAPLYPGTLYGSQIKATSVIGQFSTPFVIVVQRP